MRYVDLTTVGDSYQAYFVKKALEDEGIQCMVMNEHSSYMIPIPGPLGNGMIIRVVEEDLDAAKKILEKLKATTDQLICPNCGSNNVTLGLGSNNKFKRLAMIIFSFLFTALFVKLSLVYRCNECNTEFHKNRF